MKVATMLIKCDGKRYALGDELPDKVVNKLGEDHPAVGDPPKKAKKKTADEGETRTRRRRRNNGSGLALIFSGAGPNPQS